jgi:predicted kinase
VPVYDELSEVREEVLDTGNVVVLDEFWGQIVSMPVSHTVG